MEIFTTFAESRAEMEFLALPNLLHPPKSHAVFCMFWPYFVPRAFCPWRKGLKIKGINRPLHITSLMFRLSSDKKNFKGILKENREYLNKEFPLWRKSKYTNIFYVLKKKSANLKLAIMKKIYVLPFNSEYALTGVQSVL